MGQTQAEKREYLVLGTLDMKTWRRGLSGSVTIDELKEHMADFKQYMRIDYTPGGLVSTGPAKMTAKVP